MNWSGAISNRLIAEEQGFPPPNQSRRCGSSTIIGKLLSKPITNKTHRFVPTNNSCACAKIWKKLWAAPLSRRAGPGRRPPSTRQRPAARSMEERPTRLKIASLPPISFLQRGLQSPQGLPHPRTHQNLWRQPEGTQRKRLPLLHLRRQFHLPSRRFPVLRRR